jgi:hypothetical protein
LRKSVSAGEPRRAGFLCGKGSFQSKATYHEHHARTAERGSEVRPFDWFICLDQANKLSVYARQYTGNADTYGYIQIMIDKKLIFAHRLAFLYMDGALPPADKCVDHINGNPKDNRWDNTYRYPVC